MFEHYFLMGEQDATCFAREKLSFFKPDHELSCKEIGDGNLNYVFRVWDEREGISIIIKQAGPVARISDEMVLSTDRNRIESEVLELEGKFAKGLVPRLYLYDGIMKCCVMEDLADFKIMRTALLQHEIFPQFAEDITTFMVKTLLHTSDIVMSPKEKKEYVKRFINPELCEITEDLVYTEPFNDYNNRNNVTHGNEEWVRKELYEDAELRLEAAKLKVEFLTNAQALIHGDLHTGSIFVKKGVTKVIDPEFAFYGPMGYDVGNVIANLLFAWVNGSVVMPAGEEKNNYLDWLEVTIVEVIDLFKEKFIKEWEEHAIEVFAHEEGFLEWYLEKVIQDTAGVAGLELSRRIVGLANVKDITSIEDKEARLLAERICLTMAKKFIKHRKEYSKGEEFLQTLRESVMGQEHEVQSTR